MNPANAQGAQYASADIVRARVRPRGALELLSQFEADLVKQFESGETRELFRRCCLAVLNSGNDSDDAAALFERYPSFRAEILQSPRGVQLELTQAPARAFVDGRMVEGVKELLFAVLRDVVYFAKTLSDTDTFDLSSSAGITDAVFHGLRHANVFSAPSKTNLAVCWGGHSIPREEYDYSKVVGYELGLRGMDVCTGCGPGAMKGPMKGAAVGHAKQRNTQGRYLGFTEPGIIAAEPPNALVNCLTILPDIEKRLEAFVRAAHCIIVFPGGPGTAEEVLYLLGILMHPDNRGNPLPLILTGPRSAEAWFTALEALLLAAFGDSVRAYYTVIIDDAEAVAQAAREGMKRVRRARLGSGDAFYFNWTLRIPSALQQPFQPTHAAMAGLKLTDDAEPHALAADLRRAFSGIVAGNVKEPGVRAVREHGPFLLRAEPRLKAPLDALLEHFVAAGRMKLKGTYTPCYRLQSTHESN